MKKILIILALICAWSTAYAAASEPAAPAARAEMAPEPGVKVKATPCGVEIENSAAEPCTVVVVALTGQVVARLDAPSGTSSIELPAGYYIVRAGTATTKVAVK